MARSKSKITKTKDSVNVSVSAISVNCFHSSLPLFASALLSLDAYHIRVFDSTTSALRNDFTLDKGLTCRCLAWGSQNTKEPARKKRKVDEQHIPTGILGVGTSNGSILIYSASQESVIAKLENHHIGEVLGLAFTDRSIWSVGSDGKAIEWVWDTAKVLQTISLDSSVSLRSVAFSSPTLLVASYAIHQLHPPSSEIVRNYTAHTSPVHSLLFGPNQCFISAADDDRNINIFSLQQENALRILIADSDVRKVAVGDNVLCALNAAGAVELFDDAFTPKNSKKRKGQASSYATSKITIARSEGNPLQISDISVQQDKLLLTWMEGVRMIFETIAIRQTDGSLISTTELIRAKQTATITTNGVKDKKPYQEVEATVVAGNTTADLEMDDVETQPQTQPATEAPLPNGDDIQEEGEEDSVEPTLEQRLRELEVGTTTASQATSTNNAIPMPPASSLATVLTQALKSNDRDILESCLQHTEPKIIQTTIRRLDSTLAATLLEKLAERIARKPARASSLGVWVRWTIVVHGGFLAMLPNLVKSMSSLHDVLSARAATLPRLLALQGRLDMIDLQIQLRREGGLRSTTGEDPPDVEYIEGQSSDEEDEEIGIENASNGGADSSEGSEDERSGEEDGIEEADMSSDDDVLLTNGISDESDEE